MSVECEKVGGINLSQGVCDVPAPEPVLLGAAEALKTGKNSYTRHDGVTELRRAIARKLSDFNGIQADPESEIVVASGSTGAFYCACLALLEPGDEVIIFEPYYGYHVQTLLAVGAVPRYVRMQPPDWEFKEADIEAAVTPRTRGILINTPANPCGKVFSEAELKYLASLAQRHDFWLFTDEIYEYITYDGLRHLSPAAIPGAAERTITISGLSKTFSITGWRIGYLACEQRAAEMIGYMSDLVYVCPPAPLQYGTARGIMELGSDYYDELREDLRAKRDAICTALDEGGMAPYKPAGAYYVLADISRLPGDSSKEKAMWLLEKSGVACVPGEAFFHEATDGKNLARFCYAKPNEALHEACSRLAGLKKILR